MFGFLKRNRGVTEKALEQALDRAVRLFQAGDSLGAEREVHALVEQAAAEGKDSPVYAKALFNESTVLCGIGDLPRAAACCRVAADVSAKDQKGRKDRLTYLMNLGEILTRMDKLDEAEEVLRSSLAERKELHGANHPGYAYGLGSLADLLLAQGKADEGVSLIDQALTIYAPIAHQQFPADAALRAFLVVACKDYPKGPFFGWEELPGKVRQEIVSHVLERSERAEPKLSVAVLRDLRTTLQSGPSGGENDLLNVCIAMANAARRAEDHEARIEAGRQALDVLRSRGESATTVKGLEALAVALADAGRIDEADHTYDEAVAMAERIGDRSAEANVLRNRAIWANERGDKDGAGELHRKAMVAAESSKDDRQLGRTSAAYGIFLQHEGELEQARPLLERSLNLLPPDDPDAFYAQDHLQALNRNEKCACGDHTDETLTALVERLVMERAPVGLLKGLKVQLGDDGISVGVEVARQPTDAEAQELNRIINITIVEMQQKYRKAGYG